MSETLTPSKPASSSPSRHVAIAVHAGSGPSRTEQARTELAEWMASFEALEERQEIRLELRDAGLL